MTHFTCLEDAKKDFEKKFREKTKNKWEERDNFVAHPSKYTLIEVQGEAEDQEAVVKVKGVGRWGAEEGDCLPGTTPSSTGLPLWPQPGPFLRLCPAPRMDIVPNCSCHAGVLSAGGRRPSEDCG